MSVLQLVGGGQRVEERRQVLGHGRREDVEVDVEVVVDQSVPRRRRTRSSGDVIHGASLGGDLVTEVTAQVVERSEIDLRLSMSLRSSSS